MPDYAAEYWFERLGLWLEVGLALEAAPPWTGRVAYYANTRDSNGIIGAGNCQEGKPWIRQDSILDLVTTLFCCVRTTKEGPLLSSAIFKDRRRNDEFIEARMIMLDIDEGIDGGGAPRFTDIVDAFGGTSVMGYGSWNDGVAKLRDDGSVLKAAGPRYRIVIPLSRSVGFAEFQCLFEHLEKLLSKYGAKVDPATRNPSRIMYSPRVNPAGPGPWFSILPSDRIFSPDAMPDGAGGLIGVQHLVGAKLDEEAEQKAKRDAQLAEFRRKTPFSQIWGSEAKRYAAWILTTKCEELAAGACTKKDGSHLGSRNLSIFHIGAELGRLAHYFTDAEVQKWRARITAAAQASGLFKDIARQLDGGVAAGLREPRVLPSRHQKTETTDLYANRYAAMRSRLRPEGRK